MAHRGHFIYDAGSDPPEDDSVTLIKAGLLIPGQGEPIGLAALAYFNANGTIAYAGPSGLMPSFNVSESMSFPVVMPGLWDSHTHYGGTTCEALNDGTNFFNDLAGGYKPHTYRNMGCALQMLRESICAGVTSVRELGGIYGQALKELTESGLFPAPHFHFASKPIGMTGGHSDTQFLPVGVVRNDYNTEWDNFGAICDGVDECLKKVREQLRAQSDVIKIMTTGGVLSAFDQPTDQEFSLEEVKAMVQEAARAGRSVAAHAHGADGISVAIQAGVHSLEHGSYLNETLAQELVEHGMVFVPTITIQQTFNKTVRPPFYDPAQWAKGQVVVQHNSNAVRLAIKAGATIATGTDCPGNCAQVGREALYLYELFGMDPVQVIQCATANGPLTMGLKAPKSGILATGYDADFIVFNSSPLGNMTLLTDPSQITYVFKSGQLIKSPTNGVCNNAATGPPPSQWVITEM